MTLLGFRHWTARGGHLYSPAWAGAEPWPAGVYEATCGLLWLPARRAAAAAGPSPGQMHSAPSLGCGCGIYALYDPDRSEHRTHGACRCVAGVIEAWGRVAVAEHGFCASHARIVALVTTDLAIAHNYPGAAVFRTEAAMLLEFPPSSSDMIALALH